MLEELNIEIREATTRYVNITCKNKATGANFDFTGYTVRTHLSFGQIEQYVPTAIVGNLLSYKIPAEVSLKVNSGVAETRIFKDDNSGDVYEVLRINVKVCKAKKPDLVPAEITPSEG